LLIENKGIVNALIDSLIEGLAGKEFGHTFSVARKDKV